MEINKVYKCDCLIQDIEIEPDLIIMSPPDISSTNYSLEEYKNFIDKVYDYYRVSLIFDRWEDIFENRLCYIKID